APPSSATPGGYTSGLDPGRCREVPSSRPFSPQGSAWRHRSSSVRWSVPPAVRCWCAPPSWPCSARSFARPRRCGGAPRARRAPRAMALASRELGDLQDAEQRLRQAIQTPGAPAVRIAQARLSLATVRTERGHPLQALRLATLARAHLSPLDRAKLDTQRAVALAHLGRYQEAIASCDRAVRALVAAPGTVDDRRFLAGGLLNRGLVHAYRGGWDQAMRDITACLRIAHQAGLSHLVRLAAA